jgi:hypothetical protein
MAEGTMKAPAGLLAARSATASAVSRDAILSIVEFSVLFLFFLKLSGTDIALTTIRGCREGVLKEKEVLPCFVSIFYLIRFKQV